MSTNDDWSAPPLIETPTARRRAAPRGQHQARRALIVAVGIGTGLALLMNGSVAEPWRQIATLALALPLLLTLLVGVPSIATRRALAWVMVCGILAIGWALLQTVPLPFDGLTHPVWNTLADLGIMAEHTISVAPAATIAALPGLIVPLAVFAAMLILCQRREEVVFALTVLVVIGLALTALSILLEVAFPDIHFFGAFPVGHGAFNGIFVNRNVTASFLGMTACVTAAHLMIRDGASRSGPPITTGRMVMAVLLFLVVVTLITTRSRAGVTLGVGALALGFAVTHLLSSRSGLNGGTGRFTKRQMVAIIIGAWVGFFVLFGEPVLSRISLIDTDVRWCVWADTWRAIQDRPVTGWGLGTFSEVYPAYRDPDCLGSNNRLVRAHNSYLEFASDMGLPGVTVMLIGLVGLVRILTNGILRRRRLRAIPVFSAAALGFVALHSTADFPVQIPGIAVYFTALMGVGCAVGLLDDRVERSHERRSRSSGN
ncbi:MAG: O-antigen ligase family protein [Paracoccaceae bacterium]